MERRGAALAAAAVAGVAIIVAARLVTGGDDDSPAPDSAPVTARDGCELLTVAASSEKGPLLSRLADDYNGLGRGDDSTCVTVRVETAASGDMEAALVDGWDDSRVAAGIERPDVWTPASSTWLNLLRYEQASADNPITVPDSPVQITATPLVLAMPQPMAEAMGWPETPVGWSDVLALAADPAGWGSLGHPEWGSFTLGKTNPYISTSGLAATVGQLAAATGKSSDLTSADVADPAVQQRLGALEQAVVHYGDTTLTFLANLLDADRRGRGLSYISAVAVEEKSVFDYNAGNPSGDPATLADATPPDVPLVAVYPEEGTLYSDNPFAVLDADWVTEQQRAGAADFADWLREDAQQAEFGDAGFRSLDGQPPSSLLDAGTTTAPSPEQRALTIPSGQVLDEVRSVWDDQRKRARVMLLIDVSGSMDEPANGASGESKMELAKRAARDSLPQLTDTDEVGLTIFTTDLAGGRNHQELVPVGPLGANRQQLDAAIAALQPQNGTPLYEATQAMFDTMGDVADDQHITGVVLLSDGQNEYDGGISQEDLLDHLESRASENHVRVFTVAYGSSADLDTLTSIATATRAKAYDARDATNIGRVFTAILSNF
ncbi:substrate-binding and VWA domain-containing protein [Blastococcus sp. URHD0036]|uniref:substrate-binding and vWA domain-containing protein n=1 Tax=Blastococcus sp. URHD0036 TaxID=1380356 RepID=UPI0012DEC151|nr:substrate-binding and VWA domain-containing protein [Blastococcus sp. URHD0036]